MRWSRSPGSRMAVIRAAISRSACSASARRSMTARERASSSMRLRVADRDRRLGGERGQDLEVDLVVGAGAARHDRDRADRAGLARERRRHHRPDPHRLDEGVDLLGVVEALVREVVAGQDGPLLGERQPGHRLARLEAAGPGPVGDDRHRVAGGVGPAQGVRSPGRTGRSGRRRSRAGGRPRRRSAGGPRPGRGWPTRGRRSRAASAPRRRAGRSRSGSARARR